jgi:hypothetical protein
MIAADEQTARITQLEAEKAELLKACEGADALIGVLAEALEGQALLQSSLLAMPSMWDRIKRTIRTKGATPWSIPA